MLSGVSILCFAASYSAALILEVSRLLFRSGIRGAVMLGFASAGLVAHTAYLYYEAVNTTGAPLSSERDWCMVAAWVLVVVYLYLLCYHPRNAFGLFLLPLVLGLIAAGRFLAGSEPFAREPASKVWGMLHGSSIVLAAVAVLVGFAAGLMYFGQAWRLKRKLLPGRGLRLPSLEWLERANHRAIVVSVIMLSMGVASGVILNLIRTQQPGGRLPWSDPLVLSTGLMLGWLLLSLLIGAVYKPARAGRKVAYLTVVSFLFLVLTLGVMLFLTQHGGRGPGSAETSSAYGPLSTAYYSLPTAYCPLPTAYSTAYRLPSTAYRLRGRG